MIWEFDNGVKFYQKYLIPSQIRRYKRINLHEPEEEKLFVKVIEAHQGGMFVDVGAAGGYYSILARKLHPTIPIHAFNPRPEFIAMMREHMGLNGTPDITIHPEAISSSNGRCGIKPKWGGGIKADGNIRKRTIDDFLRGRRAHLVKLDIQGEEDKALVGARKSFKHVKHWIIGTHGATKHAACVRILRNNGYRIAFKQTRVPNQPDGIVWAVR